MEGNLSVIRAAHAATLIERMDVGDEVFVLRFVAKAQRLASPDSQETVLTASRNRSIVDEMHATNRTIVRRNFCFKAGSPQ